MIKLLVIIMAKYSGSIFVKKSGSRKTYERELAIPYDIDKDDDVQKEIARLEELSTFVRRSANRCEMTEPFLESMVNIGGIHQKYAKLMSLHNDSTSYKRFYDAIRKTEESRRVFINDCECKYKRKLY